MAVAGEIVILQPSSSAPTFFLGGKKPLTFAITSYWWDILLIHVSYRNGEWDVSIGVVALLILFWIGAETVRTAKNWWLYQRPPQE